MKIPNNYLGKTARQIWDGWTDQQRTHFLFDHQDIIMSVAGRELESKEFYGYVDVKYVDLPEFIWRPFGEHIGQGQYKKGGKIPNFDNKNLEKDLMEHIKAGNNIDIDSFEDKGDYLITINNAIYKYNSETSRTKDLVLLYNYLRDNFPQYAKGGKVGALEKELHKLQRDLNSSRLQTYVEGDNSEEEKARQRERESKLARFNEVLRLLREKEGSMAKGGLATHSAAKDGEIDAKISEKYNILRYGLKGMNIHNQSGKVLKIFNDKKTDTENWHDAVDWAKENVDKIKLEAGGQIFLVTDAEGSQKDVPMSEEEAVSLVSVYDESVGNINDAIEQGKKYGIIIKRKMAKGGNTDTDYNKQHIKRMTEDLIFVKEYKKHKIYGGKSGKDHYVVSPDNLFFIVGMDDTKRSGKREFFDTTLQDAEKYIDYIADDKMAKGGIIETISNFFTKETSLKQIFKS